MKFIKDLKNGERVETVFLLKKKEIQKTKEGKPYLRLTLADKSGSIEGRVWEDAQELDQRAAAGEAVFVKGTVEVWRDSVQIKIDDIAKADPSLYTMDRLMRTVDNIEEIIGNIERYLSTVSDKWLAGLIKKFLDDRELMEKFKTAPGAQSWHNAYIGGLAEHTYEVMVIADKVCDLYPDADRAMCLLGAFIHDIGKTIEIDPLHFNQTLEGGLIGHLPLGFEILSRKIDAFKDFPGELSVRLKHIILSHHGEYEQQSPVLPKTLEATIVYQADELMSQTNAVKELINAQAPIQKVWSNYVTIKQRKYLLTKPPLSD
ncbi:MAG: HD domain-containing protein [Candidatus Omnitrophica bacterium]|nr:HD domain-containing protein [Candidatus Omnitrophota bacterium]